MNNVIVKVFNILETVNETELYISPRDELLKPSNFGAENLIRWETIEGLVNRLNLKKLFRYKGSHVTTMCY